MSGSTIKKHMTPSNEKNPKRNLQENWRRDYNRDNKTNMNPIYAIRRLLNNGSGGGGGEESEPFYPSIYKNGFPDQWGQMSGDMMPLQNIKDWQLNPAQIDAMFAAGNGSANPQGLPVAGSFLARLAAMQQGGRNGA
jgi:hypothetical protein